MLASRPTSQMSQLSQISPLTRVFHSLIKFSEAVSNIESSNDHDTQPTGNGCSRKTNSGEYARVLASLSSYYGGYVSLPPLLQDGCTSTYLDTPDYRGLVLARGCQISPIMAPFEVPHLVGVHLEDRGRDARERVAIAYVVSV